MSGPFEILVGNLNQLGFFGFLLPFILTFTIFFALCMKSKILGEDKKIAGVLSLVVAFFVIGFGGPAIALFFSTLFSYGIIVIVGILVIAMIVAVAGGDASKFLGGNNVVLGLLALVGVLIFVFSLKAFNIYIDDDTLSVVLLIVILGAFMYFITNKS